MKSLLNITKDEQIPIYQQIINAVIDGVENGVLHENEQLPSISTIIDEHKIARQTIVKAFRILQEKGIIRAVHGKGYFVSNGDIHLKHRVFVLFDTFVSYKEVLYAAIKSQFGENAELDIYFHHYNTELFAKLLREAAGHYTSYLVLSHESAGVNEALAIIPKNKLYLIDIEPENLAEPQHGVFQNFYDDVYSTLSNIKRQVLKYDALVLVKHYNVSRVPVRIIKAFNRFCEENEVKGDVVASLKNRKPQKGEGYIVFDDEDLVYLVEQSGKEKLKIGTDLGIISYNETSLKKVVAGGISVISTDFDKLGRDAVNMILEKRKERKYNPCKFIDRGSF